MHGCITFVTTEQNNVGWWNWQTHLLVSVAENTGNPEYSGLTAP